jgi:hypothetical protein
MSVGCQPAERRIESTLRYDPPVAHEVKGFAIVDGGVDQTWARLTRQASQAPFRVLASEQKARFAVVELETTGSGRAVSKITTGFGSSNGASG